MMVPRVSILLCSIFLPCIPVLISAATVTLDSIEIYETHEWLLSKPTVYFKCKEENKTTLPDVTEKHVLYNFKGEESWQPLTELHGKKCKRCGFYEADTLKPDDIYDEWEFCASDFTRPDGKYVHFKDKELNATLLCQECVPFGDGSTHNTTSPKSHGSSGGMHWGLIVVISTVASVAFIIVLVITIKYWQKRKRQQEQARFLKLFEEGDDIEDEFGVGPLSGMN